MAVYALQYADHRALEKGGRPFRCHICQKKNNKIAKLRRCFEDRWDFDEKDGSQFPLQMTRGGNTFGFCPAKVERDDPETMSIFVMLNAILKTNNWPKVGGIEDQEYFWVELVSDFADYREDLKFNKRFEQVANAVTEGLGGTKVGNQRIPSTGQQGRRY